MSITTYTELVTELKDFLKKPRLESKIDLYIQQVEADINREMRVPEMECRRPATVNQLKIAIPVDCLELRDITAEGPNGKYTLQLASPKYLNDRARYPRTRLPSFYSIEDEAIRLDGTTGDEGIVELLYYQAIPALSSSNETNWLIDKYPLVYWYGGLLRGSEWARDDTLIKRYSGAYSAELESLRQKGINLTQGGPGGRIRGV